MGEAPPVPVEESDRHPEASDTDETIIERL